MCWGDARWGPHGGSAYRPVAAGQQNGDSCRLTFAYEFGERVPLSFAGDVSRELGKWIWIIGARRSPAADPLASELAREPTCITKARGSALRNCLGDRDTAISRPLGPAIDVSAVLSRE